MTNNIIETIGCDLGDKASAICVLDARGSLRTRRQIAAPERIGPQCAPGPTGPLDECEWKRGGAVVSPSRGRDRQPDILDPGRPPHGSIVTMRPATTGDAKPPSFHDQVANVRGLPNVTLDSEPAGRVDDCQRGSRARDIRRPPNLRTPTIGTSARRPKSVASLSD